MALTQAQIDQLKADSAVLTADAAGTDAQLAPVQATASTLATQVAGLRVVVDPQPTKLYKFPLTLSSLVVLDEQLQSGARYVRNQHHTCLTASAVALDFHWTNLDAGGTPGPFHYPQYSLWLGDAVSRGVQVAASGLVSGNKGKFTGNLGTLADGPYVARIVPLDAAGLEVVAPSLESFAPYGLWIDRTGQAKNHPLVIFQNSSYDWTHPEANSTAGAQYLLAMVPKSSIKTRTVPLNWNYWPNGNPINTAFPGVFPGGEPFSTALPANALTRINYVPTTDAQCVDERRPAVTSRGITVTDNMQGYAAETNVFWTWPKLPMLDGPRGVATLYAPTALWVGHAGAIYGMDNCSFWRIGKDGTKMTFAGLRHKSAPYWEDMMGGITPEAEIVGDWDASIPVANRYPQESWGLVADLRTTRQDTSVPKVDLPPFGMLPPHLGIGPVFFSTCRRGRILKYQFDKTKPNTVPKITEFVTGLNDPWGLGIDQVNGILYVTERGRHAISMWSADDGRGLGDLIVNPNGATFGAVSTSLDRSWKFSGLGLTGSTPNWALCRAQPILAPEGCEYQDGYVYWGALAHAEVRRINVATKVVEVCTRIPVYYGGQSKWVDLKLSDGSFGPRGTIFTTSNDNQTSGRPRAWLPGAGVDADGTTLTNKTQWMWTNESRHIPRGPGGRTHVGLYATGLGVGNGMLACGSTGPGLLVFMKATLGEALPNEASIDRGAIRWREQGHHLLHGNYGYGHVNMPLPFGETADMDNYLHWAGH